MLKIRYSLIAVLAAGILVAPALALELGDKAPPLKVEKWVKGDPVEFKDGHVYVVEFWATWCGPCKKSIPHLTELQKEYKDKNVTIIGISSSDKSLDLVNEFVEERGDQMAYTVAYEPSDDKETFEAYMKPFNQRGIPTAFIVNKEGKLVWFGHPAAMDEPLKQIVAGRYDLDAFKKEMKKRQEQEAEMAKAGELMNKYFAAVTATKNEEEADKIAKELMPAIEKNAMMLNALAWNILTGEDVLYRDHKLALKAAERASELEDHGNAAVLDTYALALWENGQKKKAVEMQRKAVALADDDEEMKAELQGRLERFEKEINKK